MNNYRVTVTVNGTNAGTYSVQAEREGLAQNAARRAMFDARRAGLITTPKAASADGIDFMEYKVEAV